VEAEVKHHKQLSHPSILTLYDAFEDSKYVYLVMELCPRGELYKFISQRKIPLCEAETRGVMIQLIKGIQCMHSHGIMHRDLKLSNILLTEEFDVVSFEI
jgi:polo-like kinase 4